MPPTSSAITGMPLKLAGSLLQLRNSRSAARCGFGQKTRPSSDILAHQRPCIIVPPWPGKDQSGPCKMWELKWDQIFRNSTLSCKNNTIKWLTGAQKRTRTSTTLRSPAPEAGASTNSAIWARGRSGRLAAGRRACQPRRPAPRQILFQSRGFVALARPAPPFALAPSGASRHGDARDAAASGFENRQDRQG